MTSQNSHMLAKSVFKCECQRTSVHEQPGFVYFLGKVSKPEILSVHANMFQECENFIAVLEDKGPARL